MNRKIRRNIIRVLLIVLICVLLLEGFLAAFDPWGIYYFDDVRTLFEHATADAQRGYVIADGSYTLHRTRVNIVAGTRVVPDTNPNADCTLIMLGDSLTFGHGVNDDETFSNYLAQAFSNLHIINTGVDTYNSTNILGTLRAFPEGDAYIYMIVSNDVEPQYTGGYPAPRGYIGNYFFYLLRRLALTSNGGQTSFPPEDLERYFEELDAMVADPRVILAGTDGTLIREVEARGYAVNILRPYTSTISYVDGHPDPAGHRFIAEQLAPIVNTTVIAEKCALP
jgi:hypothetical protein